jgi:peptidoglycan/xylan/chitin deacetylase (PgdA/CDA1 family)
MLGTLVTTSWDDGHPLDLRTAERLRYHGFTGTFYATAMSSKRLRLPVSQLRELAGMGVEIGSHTLTHPVLTGLDPDSILHELQESKKALEDVLGRPVTSVCYPKGKFNRLVCTQAAKAGYTLARTTVAFRTNLDFSAFEMPVSCQFARLPWNRVVRHLLHEGNHRGAADWVRFYKMETDPVKLACRIFDRLARRGGVLHIWGHSWEMSEQGLWGDFDELLSRIGRRPDVNYVTNAEVLDYRNRLSDPALVTIPG